MAELGAGDLAMRRQIYRFWCERGRPPGIAESAAGGGVSTEEARAARQRLHEAHMLLLEADGERIRMANPLSGVATGFRARVDGIWLDANCAWDAPGIAAMLGRDAELELRCSPDDEIVRCRVRDGRLEGVEGLVHFALPFRRWYEDLVET